MRRARFLGLVLPLLLALRRASWPHCRKPLVVAQSLRVSHFIKSFIDLTFVDCLEEVMKFRGNEGVSRDTSCGGGPPATGCLRRGLCVGILASSSQAYITCLTAKE